MRKNDECRQTVLAKIVGSRPTRKIGQVTYELEGRRLHIKVKNGNLDKYPFNINHAVLLADYEVYVCGTEDVYYVVPIEMIRQMHADLAAMPDKTHPGLTIVDVYPAEDCIRYARGGKSLDIARFRNTVWKDV